MRRYAVLLCLAAVAACAPTAPVHPEAEVARQTRPRQCFDQSRVTNFRQGDARSLYIRVLNRDVYQLSAGGCLDIDFAVTLAITQDFGGSGQVCVGDTVRLYTAGGPGVTDVPCRARIDRKLTEAEIEALPSRQRP